MGAASTERVSELAEAIGRDISALSPPSLVVIDSEAGEYRYTFADHGRQTTGGYVVLCETDSPKVTIDVSEKTPESFLLSVKSKGVHYQPQPVDCSENPVTVSLKIIGG